MDVINIGCKVRYVLNEWLIKFVEEGVYEKKLYIRYNCEMFEKCMNMYFGC